MKSESKEIKELRDRRVYSDYKRLRACGNTIAAIYKWLRYNYYIASDHTIRAIIKRQEVLDNGGQSSEGAGVKAQLIN